MNLSIFHEKQEGALCAQHCLNSLLQGPYYTAVDLASFAKQLDDEEKERMAEGDVNSPDYVKFIAQPSSNMDDTGYFSIQVICKALEVWGLESVPYDHPRAKSARENPTDQTAFICNLQQHWFTIRKIGNNWYNLNSLFSEPELVSDTYLRLLLAQLKTEGYSIFVIIGKLPQCEADRYTDCLVNTPSKETAADKGNIVGGTSKASSTTKQNDDQSVDLSFIREKRMQYYNGKKPHETENAESEKTEKLSVQSVPQNDLDDVEEEMLKAAVAMSLQMST